jgi:hypothetical protein
LSVLTAIYQRIKRRTQRNNLNEVFENQAWAQRIEPTQGRKNTQYPQYLYYYN